MAESHEVVPVCSVCGEPCVADYDGEIWHKSDWDAYEERMFSYTTGPEITVELMSFKEQVAEYRRTGVKPAPLDEKPKIYGRIDG